MIADWADGACRAFATEKRPLGPARAVADGPQPRRILLIGGGAAVGRGFTSHDLALPGAIARALRARTGRGAVVDIIADPELTAVGLTAVLGTVELALYDAVITTVGDIDALRGIAPRDWRDRVRSAMGIWQHRVTDGRVLLMVAIPSLRDEPAVGLAHGRVIDAFTSGLNAITEEAAEEHSGVRTTLLPEAQRVAGRVSPETVELWGAQLADELLEHLPARRLGAAQPSPDSVASGHEDADRIARILSDSAPRLDHIVTMAAASLNAPTAVITVLGTDPQWHAARFGLELDSVPIEQSFCAVAVRNKDGMVVPDAPRDPRFARNPLVEHGGIRYYAGVPIEDAEGRRIGALCVIDTKPRNLTSAADMAVLRRLARRVERALQAEPLAVPAWTPGAPTSPDIASAVTAPALSSVAG